MQNRLIEFTAENKVLDMQVQDMKSRNSDINLSLTREHTAAHESRKEMEIEMVKRRVADLDSQVKILKDELHRAKVDKERYSEKYENTLEDNRLLKDQMFSMKKLILELEKKDFGLVQKIRELETTTEAKIAKNQSSLKPQPESVKISEEPDKLLHRVRASSRTDERPIKPQKGQTSKREETTLLQNISKSRASDKFRTDLFSSQAVLHHNPDRIYNGSRVEASRQIGHP